MAVAFDVLYRGVHHRSSAAFVAAGQHVSADDYQIESSLELQCDRVVGSYVRDVIGVDGQRIDDRSVAVAKVQYRAALEAGESIENWGHCMRLYGLSLHVEDGRWPAWRQ